MPALRLFACIFSLLLTVHSHGQSYYFKHYQVEQGLSNNTIYCSLQDKNGFLWFGTKEGLNRFDGSQFKLLTLDDPQQPGTVNNFIYALHADPQGTMWVGTQRGFYRYEEKQEALVCITDSLKDIGSISMDANGLFWFISRNRVFTYNPATGHIERKQSSVSIFASSVTRSTKDEIWLADFDGYIYRYQAEADSFIRYNVFQHSPPAATKWINKLKPSDNGDIFICTSGQGLKKFIEKDSSYIDIINYNQDKTLMYARDVLQYRKNEFWIASESGIYIYDEIRNSFTNLTKKFQDPYSISDNAVYNLCMDREGGVWAGTYFGGVNYFPNQFQPFRKYYPDLSNSQISGNAVREISSDDSGNLWIATEDAGLNKLNPATGAVQHFMPTGKKGDISYSNIHGLLVDGDDVWIGTFEHGLDVLDRKTSKVYRKYVAGPEPNKLKSNFVLTILKHSNGSIYFGTSNGIFRYRRNTDDFEALNGIPASIFGSTLIEDHRGIIWIGTHGNGMYQFDPAINQGRHFPLFNQQDAARDNLYVNTLLEDNEKQLWIGTEGQGLIQMTTDRSIHHIYTVRDGLPTNYIFKVLQDKLGYIWISSSRGLAKFSPLEKQFTTFKKANGLLNNQFNYNSGYRDRNGVLYFGSIKGMISFQPQDFRENTYQPPLYITGFQVHNKELPIGIEQSPLKNSILQTEKIKLAYDQSSFSIDFAALSYTSPEVTRYQYRMQGVDDQWIPLETNRKVYFTNLAPGSYQFLVKATTSSGKETSTRMLNIHITPPAWATWWAYLIYGIIAFSLIWWLIVTYHNRTQLKKEKEIYSAKIDFFTNVAHEIKTPLTLIKGPVENLQDKTEELPAIKKDVAMLERNTNRLLTLVQQILDFRQTETSAFQLTFTQVSISNLVKEVVEDFQPLADKKKLSYQVCMPSQELIESADEDALQKIFSNLVSNAIKYAKSQVQIKLLENPEENYWQLILDNDGLLIADESRLKIFEPFYRIRETSREKGTGIGLPLSRSLAELHNGNIQYVQHNQLNRFILTIFTIPTRAKTN